ncbi:MAG TPA: T9SS type A sorting domain-containing protein, partial [Phaeodactylibacter sp.]|nr:T9SS type A sorting domain-containing protein [Phaeodactylibacter sp.]
THPYYGKIAVFNNRVGSDFSTANVISQPWDMYAGEYTLDGDFWGPTDFDITITHPTPQKMYSNIMSSIQFLPNGNRLLCVGRWGYIFEMTPDDEIVWEYITPIAGATPATQGDTLQINQNLTFEIKRYPTDYAAFTGKDLTPQGYLELNPNTEFCEVLATHQPSKYQLKVYPNPANDLLVIEWEKGGKEVVFQIYDIMGRKIEDMTATGGRKYLDISHWENGIYLVVINGEEVQRVVKN